MAALKFVRLTEGIATRGRIPSRNISLFPPIAAHFLHTSQTIDATRSVPKFEKLRGKSSSSSAPSLITKNMADLTKLGVALTVGGAIGATAASYVLGQKLTRGVATQATATTKPVAKQTKDAPLKLYIYDHCPFCVRARMIFGLKKVDHQLIFLANHDEASPIGLVGTKQAPILELPSGKAFPESMDIVRYVDENYGGAAILKEASGREDIKQWIKDSAETFRLIYHPRFHKAVFAEFAQLESREYYRIKKEKTIGSFEEALAKTPELKKQAEKHLEDLAKLFHSNRSVNAGGVSYDDIDLFGRLRGLTLLKDLKWPQKLREYIDHYEAAADIPLLDSMAQY